MPGGREEGLRRARVGPLQAGPRAGLEAATRCCGPAGAGTSCLTERCVGSSGQRGRSGGGRKGGRLSSAGGVPGHHGCCGQGKGWGVRSKALALAVLAPRAGAGAEYVWQKGQWNLPEF